MKKKITIGSRGSKLALLYAQKVKEKIIETTNFTDQDVNIEKISTKGDEIQDTRLSDVGGKGLFSSSIELELQKNNNSLYGSDELINKYSREDVRYDIRFHLYPGISAVQTMGGNSVLIQIKKNKSLMFTSKGQKLFIEKSIFLAGNKILNNLCIKVSLLNL